MGKASKRERQKANKIAKEEQLAKKQVRSKRFKAFKGLALILVIPIVIAVSLLISDLTKSDEYTAKITVEIEGEKNLPNNGVIEMKFDWDRAPKSSKHFIGFAKDGLYDGMEWHRVVKDFVIQGGDPNGDGTGALGSTVTAELPTRKYRTGDIAWAKGSNEPPGTAGSQFFVVTGSEDSSGVKALSQKVPSADGTESFQYGFIGTVTKGIAVALKIESLAPEKKDGEEQADSKPTKKAKILKVEVFKNGKPIKRGDKNFPAATTTTTTTTTIPGGQETTDQEIPIETTQ